MWGAARFHRDGVPPNDLGMGMILHIISVKGGCYCHIYLKQVPKVPFYLNIILTTLKATKYFLAPP